MTENYLLSSEKRTRVCSYCGKNLRRLRKKLNMNQKQLALAVGTTQRHISEIENGKAKVSWTLMLALSTIFVLQSKKNEDYEKQVSAARSTKYAEGEYELETMLTELKEGVWLMD